MKFEFDKRTGMMIPKKNEQIYFASSVGGGLRVDDRKHNVKFIVERNGKITNIAGIYDSSVNLYDFNDARVIADRVARMFGRNHKYADYHYFLKGVVRESEVMDFDGYVNEMWGTDVKTDQPGKTIKKNKFHSIEEIREYLKSEIERQGENVVIKNLDVSLIEDLSYLFDGIGYDVKALNLSGWKTSGVKKMADMFYSHYSLKSLDLSGWDTSNVENMYGMFGGCESLESLDISGWDTSNVENMYDMFSECRKLKSLDLSGWNTSKVKDMSYMFYGCRSLESLDLSGWDTSNVRDMSYMFKICSKLKSLNLSGLDTSNVENMYDMFASCKSLESLDLSSWDISNVKNMSCMFFRCSNLESLNLSGWDTSNVKSMNNIFWSCPAPYKEEDGKIVKK